jgi:hypothetical protein
MPSKTSSQQNLRVRQAMAAACVDHVELAKRVGCDPKTVQRWYYEGRVPQRRHADRVADALGVPVGWLWPTAGTEPEAGLAIEVVLKLGRQALVAVDGGDDPPVMWIRSGHIEVMIAPAGVFEGGELSRSDLERASDLVMAAVAYRTAIHNELVKSGVVQGPISRPMAAPLRARGSR